MSGAVHLKEGSDIWAENKDHLITSTARVQRVSLSKGNGNRNHHISIDNKKTTERIIHCYKRSQEVLLLKKRAPKRGAGEATNRRFAEEETHMQTVTETHCTFIN